MLKSLHWKLTLAFALVAFISAALVAMFTRLTSDDRLSQLVVDQKRSELEQALLDYYASNGSWEGVGLDLAEKQFQTLPDSGYLPAGHSQSVPVGNVFIPVSRDGENLVGLADAEGTVIFPVERIYPAGSRLPAEVVKAGTPILSAGEQVGTILVAGEPPWFNPEETRFLERTDEALISAGLGALLVALLLGIFLSRTLTGPLKELTLAAQSITHGEIEQQVRVSSNDEVGQLATAFNRMSQEVARVNHLRRQMTADIAHDLRTPLTVISGYVESMRDGVLQPTPQRLALIYSEIERLQNMVGDLQMLSLADAGELSLTPQRISPKVLLDRAADLFRHQAGQKNVRIDVVAKGDLPEILVDEARMMQVMDNLISNALRYTPSEGVITLSAQVSGDQLEICVQDTGEGIPGEELPFVFNRFHRVDKSRHTETGETGLGLAIVKALVETHGGFALAEATPGQGTTIQLMFPVDPQPVQEKKV